MKREIIDISDLSDSREVMLQKAPRSISCFVVIIGIIVSAALIFSCFGKIETHIEATGEIRPAEAVANLTSISGGKIVKILAKDGQVIKKGDVIFEFDDCHYVSQKESIEFQISERELKIEQYKKLIDGIKIDKNPFSEIINPELYYTYKSYENEKDDAVLQLKQTNQQKENSIKEADEIISNANYAINSYTELYNEYLAFYNCVDTDKAYKGKNKNLLILYNNYLISREKASAIYNGCLVQYESLKKQHEANPSLIDYNQVQQAFHAMDATYYDLLAVKSNFLLKISETLNSFQEKIDSYESTIKNYNLKKTELIIDTDYEKRALVVKETYYLKINTSISSLESEIYSLLDEKENLNNTISNSKLISEKSGIILFSKEYSVGDVVSASEVVCNIIPQEENYKIVMYIPEFSISETFVGQEVEYIIASAPNVDFGKIHGTITEIAQDSFVDQTTGQKYYKALATLPCTKLTDKDGQERILKCGMLVEIHAVTGQKKIITWLLEKLNFI